MYSTLLMRQEFFITSSSLLSEQSLSQFVLILFLCFIVYILLSPLGCKLYEDRYFVTFVSCPCQLQADCLKPWVGPYLWVEWMIERINNIQQKTSTSQGFWRIKTHEITCLSYVTNQSPAQVFEKNTCLPFHDLSFPLVLNSEIPLTWVNRHSELSLPLSNPSQRIV